MEKLLIGSARHLQSQGGLRDFEYLLYNFPFNCKLHCSICCNKDRKTESPRQETLSEGELKNIIEESAKLGARVFGSMGLGEPLISPHFDLLVESAHENGMIPYFFTNALDLDEKRSQFLNENGATLIIHLDSLQKKKYCELYNTTGENFDTVFKNIERARKAFRIVDNGLSRLALNMVVRRQNISEVRDINEFCGDDIVFVINTLLDRTDSDYLSEEEIHNLTGIKTTPLGTTGGACDYLKRGIAIQGRDILVCPYSDLKVGRIDNVSDVARQIGKAEEFVRKFYAEHGNSRCFVRHPDYRNLTTL